jgi:aspartate/methionine/tyrosine aminotransferase
MRYLPVGDDSKRHVNYQDTLANGDSIVVVFRVGYMQHPPKAAEEAYARINRLVREAAQDLQAIREYHGNLVLYSMVAKTINPDITEHMKQEFREAAEAMYPEWRIATDWECQQSGIAGFSVQMVRRK